MLRNHKSHFGVAKWIIRRKAKKWAMRSSMNNKWIKLILQNKKWIGAGLAGIAATLAAAGLEGAGLIGLISTYLLGSGLHKSDKDQKTQDSINETLQEMREESEPSSMNFPL